MFKSNLNLRMSFLKIKNLIRFSLFTFLIILPGFINAQTEVEEPAVNKPTKFDPLVDNILDKLPPLQILIDSAVRHAPWVRISDVEISMMRYNIKNAKIEWTRNLGFMGELLTGNLYQFSNNQTSGSTPNEFITNRYEYAYHVGLYYRMPINAIIGQKNNVNIAKRELEKNILLKEERSMAIRKEVILVYQDLLMRQELLKIKNESQLTTRMQVQMAEIEFKNGTIKIAELARLVDINAINSYSYKEETFLFYRQYLILEELVGMKFNLISEIE
jgi:hypothetical protein